MDYVSNSISINRKRKNASVLVISRQIALIVPLIIILPMLMGIEGVWAAVPITDGIVFIVTAIMMINEYKGIGKAHQSKVEVEGKGSKKLLG